MIINPTIYGGDCEDKSKDLTAKKADIRKGQTALVNGAVVTGEMPNVSLPTPSISVNSDGYVSSSVSLGESGYIQSGTKSNGYQLTTVSGNTIRPSPLYQTAIEQDRYTLGKILVEGDSNLQGKNIKEGIRIFGIDGSYSPKIQETTVRKISNDKIGIFVDVKDPNDILAVRCYLDGEGSVSDKYNIEIFGMQRDSQLSPGSFVGYSTYGIGRNNYEINIMANIEYNYNDVELQLISYSNSFYDIPSGKTGTAYVITK